MGGFFAVASKSDCVSDLFYGTDYHSHLGTQRGGLAVHGNGGFVRSVHDITGAPFRTQLGPDLPKLRGRWGIGAISDLQDQPLLVGSHLGRYAIVTVGRIRNAEELARQAFRQRTTLFADMAGEINPTELTATLINQEATFEEGIRRAQESIEGSCSMLLLTEKGIYAARDRLGRTPVVLGARSGACAAALESCSFPNLGFEHERDLGPGEVVLMTEDGAETVCAPGSRTQICTFLWVYYGYPASSYEGVNVEMARNRCGAALARDDAVEVDLVSGIPDSGTGHALGYANARRLPYERPFVKYTPTWPRGLIGQDSALRDLVARMKLIPIGEIIRGKRMLFCEDSIVRGTQLRGAIQRLYDFGAREVHMRVACPPLAYSCKFLNFARPRSELDLAARKAMKELAVGVEPDLRECVTCGTEKNRAVVERVRQMLRLSSLKYQRLEDLVAAVGLPREKLCTYCWDGTE
jgi:amidophosphoribosyltransferase